MNSPVVNSWHKVRFLESTSNLKPLLKSATGRCPAGGLLREVSACLQQGRLYYESASTAALEIKPLLLYYGFLAFARGIVLARGRRRLSTLARGHGLKDKPHDRGRIADTTVAIHRSGTFTEFNDVVRHFSRLCHSTKGGQPLSFVVPASAANELAGSEWTLNDLLSRLPDVRDLYAATFRQESKLLPVRILAPSEWHSWHTLLIEEQVKCEGLPQLSILVGRWRERFPWLRQWRFESAYLGWNQVTVRFASLVNDGHVDEFSEAHVRANNGEHETP